MVRRGVPEAPSWAIWRTMYLRALTPSLEVEPAKYSAVPSFIAKVAEPGQRVV